MFHLISNDIIGFLYLVSSGMMDGYLFFLGGYGSIFFLFILCLFLFLLGWLQQAVGGTINLQGGPTHGPTKSFSLFPN